MKKVYIVKCSFSELEYYTEIIHKVFNKKEDAEKEKEIVIKSMSTAPEFPYENEGEMLEAYYKRKLPKKQRLKILDWWTINAYQKEFKKAWVEEYDVK